MRKVTAAFAILIVGLFPAAAQTLDWPKVDDEAMRLYQSLIRIDSTTTEAGVAQFLKQTLEAEEINVTLYSKDPGRPT